MGFFFLNFKAHTNAVAKYAIPEAHTYNLTNWTGEAHESGCGWDVRPIWGLYVHVESCRGGEPILKTNNKMQFFLKGTRYSRGNETEETYHLIPFLHAPKTCWQCSHDTTNRCSLCQNRTRVDQNLLGPLPLHSAQSQHHPAWYSLRLQMVFHMTTPAAEGRVLTLTLMKYFTFLRNAAQPISHSEAISAHLI